MKKHSRHIILSVAAVFPLVLAVVVSATVEDVTAKRKKQPTETQKSYRLLGKSTLSGKKSWEDRLTVYPELEATQIFNYSTLDLEFVVGDPRIDVRMDVDDIREHIKITQEGNKLYFYSLDDNASTEGSITVALPELTALYSYSIADMRAVRLEGNKVSVYGYGVGNVEIGEADVQSLTLCQGGVGDMRVENVVCHSAKLIQNGVGDLRVSTFKGTNAELVLNGVGDLRVPHLSADFVRVNNNGVGDVVISGDECRSLTLISYGVGNIVARGMKAVKLIRVEEGTGSIRM